MDDIVARLKLAVGTSDRTETKAVSMALLRDAADEIERLRAICIQVSNLSPGDVSNLNARAPQSAGWPGSRDSLDYP